MTEIERTEARQAAERKHEVPQLRRITDRIEYKSKSRGGPGCDMCDRVARLPQPISANERRQANPARDGDRPDKDSRHLAFKKRTRLGPHR